MSDNKSDDNIKFDQEIENLDSFLEEQDEAYPLEDDDELSAYGAPSNIEKSGGIVKYLGYLILLVILGGVVFFGVKMAPKFLGNAELAGLNDLQNNIMSRTNDIIDDGRDLMADNNGDAYIAPVSSEGALPLASDTPETNNVISEIENSYEEQQGYFEDAPAFADNTVIADETIVFNDATPNDPTFEGDMIEIQDDDEIILEDETSEADDLDPILESNIDTANNVAKMQNDEVIDLIEAVDEVAEVSSEMAAQENLSQEAQDIIVENSVKDVVTKISEEKSKSNVDEVDASNADNMIATTDISDADVDKAVNDTLVEAEEIIMEVKDIPQLKAEPVPSTPSAPKKIVVNNEPLKSVDPRVNTARTAYEAGDYMKAANLYQQVLSADPSSTAALTGIQLSKAKLRMQGVSSASITPQVAPTAQPFANTTANPSAAPVAPAAALNSNSVDMALAKINADPRNANLAVNLAQAYASTGNTAKATEWYRKALQLDVLSNSGIDRMAVYDALAALQ